MTTGQETLSTGRGVLMVAGGILVALVVVLVVQWAMRPSDADCAIQRSEVLLGERVDVDSACEDR